MTKRQLLQEQLIEALYERAELAADYILEADNSELVELFESIPRYFQTRAAQVARGTKNKGATDPGVLTFRIDRKIWKLLQEPQTPKTKETIAKFKKKRKELARFRKNKTKMWRHGVDPSLIKWQ